MSQQFELGICENCGEERMISDIGNGMRWCVDCYSINAEAADGEWTCFHCDRPIADPSTASWEDQLGGYVCEDCARAYL